MKQFTLLTLTLIISFSSFAQLIKVGNENEAIETKNKVLLVRLYEIGDSDLKAFSNDDEFVTQQNEMLKSVFSSNWDLNKTIEYVSKDEMEKRLKETPDKYVVVDRSWGVDYKPTTQGSRAGMYGGSSKKKFDIFEVQYGLPKGKKGDKLEVVFSMAFPEDALGELDYRFFASQCNEYVKAAANGIKSKDETLWDPEKNISVIKNKTLYVLEGSFKGDYSDAESSYCGKMEAVSVDQLYEKLINEPESALFITTLWSYKKKLQLYVIVDAETYDMRGLIGAGGVQFELAPTSVPSKGGYATSRVVHSIPLWGNIGLKAKYFKVACKAGAQKINY